MDFNLSANLLSCGQSMSGTTSGVLNFTKIISVRLLSCQLISSSLFNGFIEGWKKCSLLGFFRKSAASFLNLKKLYEEIAAPVFLVSSVGSMRIRGWPLKVFISFPYSDLEC